MTHNERMDMSFVGCTFNYGGCGMLRADFMIVHDGDDVSPSCKACLKRALDAIGRRLVRVVPAD